MSPFIKDGDILTVSPLADEAPKMGEVVIFLHPVSRKPTVHRVIGCKGSACLVKGDNTPGRGHLLPGESILGRLDRLERNGKRVFFGLGPERLLIAFLARGLWLHRFLLPLGLALQSRFKNRTV